MKYESLTRANQGLWQIVSKLFCNELFFFHLGREVASTNGSAEEGLQERVRNDDADDWNDAHVRNTDQVCSDEKLVL